MEYISYVSLCVLPKCQGYELGGCIFPHFKRRATTLRISVFVDEPSIEATADSGISSLVKFDYFVDSRDFQGNGIII